MEIKATLLGILIYAAMLCYSLAWAVQSSQKRRKRDILFAVGFVMNFSAVVYRGVMLGHLPMQTMFEVFLLLAMLVYPISVFSKRRLRLDTTALDVMIAVILIFPAAFIFPSHPKHLPPSLQSAFFGPHVGAYLLSYVFMFKAAAISAKAILSCSPEKRLTADTDSRKMVCLGFPLMTLGLLLGCFWAKSAWGRFWGWDPKELWALASWLIYAAYFQYRSGNGTRHIRINHLLVITGMLFIVITLVWVNVSRLFTGLHNYAA
jgi:ABC-type transport system involved in cytochrome c biogenesis permease subunit